MLFSDFDLLFLETMQFTAAQVAQVSGLPEDVVQRVLHAFIGGPTYADAILDRLVHNPIASISPARV